MRKVFTFFFVILILTCLASQTVAAQKAYTVAYVIDGDTFVLDNGTRIRLAYIDTPESQYKKRKQQYFSIRAKNFIASTVLKKEIFLKSVVSKDRYGRLVAIVTLRDGRDVGALLIQKGMAFVYPHGKKHSSYVRKLTALQRKAIDAEVGMWEKVIAYFNDFGKVIGNRRSKRLFTLNCKRAKDIAERNRIYFRSAIEGFYKGYAPARICKLWPASTDILMKLN